MSAPTSTATAPWPHVLSTGEGKDRPKAERWRLEDARQKLEPPIPGATPARVLAALLRSDDLEGVESWWSPHTWDDGRGACVRCRRRRLPAMAPSSAPWTTTGE